MMFATELRVEGLELRVESLELKEMEGIYHKSYSKSLGRDMEYKTWGEKGHPILVFPSQDGRYYDYANFGMVDILMPWIESGKARVICCDGIDGETWSRQGQDNRWRIEQHERWYNYIIEELLPEVRLVPGETFITTGCSMGAFHAANFFFRRPDVFDSVIALSGLYTASYGFPGYSDDLTYMNSPVDFLREMPLDHPWIDLYKKDKIFICVGQGRWEDELLDSTRQLDGVLKGKGIPAFVDYWGYDVDHDWPWWRRQLPYFMEKVLGKS